MAASAGRTAATAAIWPSMRASRISPGSQRSISENRGLARSVSMPSLLQQRLTPVTATILLPLCSYNEMTRILLEKSVMNPNLLILGVDGGGTHCRARLCALCGPVLGEATAGAANLRLGVERSFSSIVEA